eukprot:scaffold2822_cov208-Chaetoceros_neogracile.AAC.3
MSGLEDQFRSTVERDEVPKDHKRSRGFGEGAPFSDFLIFTRQSAPSPKPRYNKIQQQYLSHKFKCVNKL